MSVAKDTVLVRCEAYDHILALQVDEEDSLLYLSLFISQFYAKQHSWAGRWWERIKIASTVLLGREYQFEDIILGEDAQRELASFFEKRR